MSPDKEKTIFDRWPQWFRDKGNLRVSLMSWGFNCGDGWYEIIYPLCERLEPLVAALDDGGEAFQVFQVKEKFGGLRFYVEASSDEIYEALIRRVNSAFTPARYAVTLAKTRRTRRLGGRLCVSPVEHWANGIGSRSTVR